MSKRSLDHNTSQKHPSVVDFSFCLPLEGGHLIRLDTSLLSETSYRWFIQEEPKLIKLEKILSGARGVNKDGGDLVQLHFGKKIMGFLTATMAFTIPLLPLKT